MNIKIGQKKNLTSIHFINPIELQIFPIFKIKI